MAEDELTEWMVGQKGAVRCIGKFYVMPARDKVESMPKSLVAGLVVSQSELVLPENESYSEMWEGEIIILPRRKYSGKLKTGIHAYSGHRVDQVLAGGFGNPENWGKKYFDINETPF